MRLFRPEPLFRLAGVVALIAAPLGGAAADKPAAPPAPVSNEPQNTMAAYSDWIVHCARSDAAAQRSCELEQPLQAQTQQGQPTTIAQIALGRPSPKDPFKLVVTVLPSVSFPGTLKLSIDDKDTQPIDLQWLRCAPGGCIAAGDMKDDDIKRWKTQTGKGRIQFKDATGHDQLWPFSFLGFSQAMDGLAKAQ